MLSPSRKLTGLPTSFMVGAVKTMISTIGSSGQIWPSIVIRLTWPGFSCSNIIKPTPTKILVKWWKKAWKTNWTTMGSVPSIIRYFWPRLYIVVLGIIFFSFFQFLFGLIFSFSIILLFPFSIWTFISFFYFDFYSIFLFGLFVISFNPIFFHHFLTLFQFFF